MPIAPRPNTGALFPTDKNGNAARPDWRGDVLYNGELLEVAGWTKSGQKGEFIALSVKPKTQDEPKPEPAPRVVLMEGLVWAVICIAILYSLFHFIA